MWLIHSLAPRRMGGNFKCNIRGQIEFMSTFWFSLDKRHRAPLMIMRNGLVPSDYKPLPESILASMYLAIWRH